MLYRHCFGGLGRVLIESHLVAESCPKSEYDKAHQKKIEKCLSNSDTFFGVDPDRTSNDYSSLYETGETCQGGFLQAEVVKEESTYP